MSKTVTMMGNPLELHGITPEKGKAPEFMLVDKDLNEVSLSSFSGKTVVISVTPSLDTPVCDLQAKRFNQEAGTFSNIAIVNVSMDLPFAIKRFCTESSIEDLLVLSDHRNAEFGEKYGVLIKGLRLLCRAVFIISETGEIVYTQIVPEITEQPDYNAVLEKLNALKGQEVIA